MTLVLVACTTNLVIDRSYVRSSLDPVSPSFLGSSLSALFSFSPRCIDPRDRSRVINSLYLSLATQHYVTLLSLFLHSFFVARSFFPFNFSPLFLLSSPFLRFPSPSTLDRLKFPFTSRSSSSLGFTRSFVPTTFLRMKERDASRVSSCVFPYVFRG